MELFYPNIICYISALVIFTLFFYAIGRIVVVYLSEFYSQDNFLLTTFISVIFGVVIVVSIFAIVWTKMNSTMWLIVFCWVAYIFCWRKKYVADTKYKVREFYSVAVLLFVEIVAFFVLYYLFYIRSQGQIFCDQIYYSNLSQTILLNHIESGTVLNSTGAKPYHWGDIWLTSFVFINTKLNSLYVLTLITYPLFLSLTILGVISFAKQNIDSDSRWKWILYSLGSVAFITCLLIPNQIIPWDREIFSNPKFFIVSTILIAGTIYLYEKKYSQSFFILLLIVALYMPMAVGVVSFVCLISLKGDNTNVCNRICNKYIIFCLLITLFVFLFYWLQPSENKLVTSTVLLRDNPIRDAILFIVKRIGRPLSFTCPIMCVVVICWYNHYKCLPKNYIYIFTCLMISCFVSICAGALFRQINNDGTQIATNFYELSSKFFVLASIVYLIQLYNDFKLYTFLVTSILSLVVICTYIFNFNNDMVYIVSQTNKSEYNTYFALKNRLGNEKDVKFGYFRNYSIEENHNTQRTRYNMFFPLDKMPHIIKSGYYYPFCLSVFDLPEDILPMWNNMKSSEFFKFTETQKNKGVFQSNVKSMCDFINYVGINYIIVEDKAIIPNELNDKLTYIVSYDKTTIYKVIN